MDIPLQAKGVDEVSGLGIGRFVQFCQETMKQLATTHPGGWFSWAGDVDVNDLRHKFLILD